MFIIKHKSIFLFLAALLVIASIVIMSVKGFVMGVDFVGGSVTEVSYSEGSGVTTSQIREALTEFDYSPQVQQFGENGFIIRTRELSEDEREKLLAALSFSERPVLERFNTIGPSVGKELRTKAVVALVLVAIAIILFVAFVFRKVSKPVSSWKYGIIAVVALCHDVIIPAGIFALLGIEVNSLFIVGLLSILGLSVNDTIVVFDRIRENLKTNEEKGIEAPFEEVIGKSISQTLARSINTSLTILIVLVVLFFVGPASTKSLALVLFLGTFFGTYSSIAVASPLLVLWNKKKASK